MKKHKEPGRPTGSPNAKSAYERNIHLSTRVTEGCMNTIDEIIEAGKHNGKKARYKSRADVLHTAIEILAKRELPGDYYWLNKIQ